MHVMVNSLTSTWSILLLQTSCAFMSSEQKVTSSHLSGSGSSSCPFSRSFPQYRIDWTPVAKKKEGIFGLPFLQDWSKSSVKSKLERELGRTAVQWIPSAHGIQAIAALWLSAAQAIDLSQKERALAFPDTENEVIIHWVDMFNWLQENQPSDECRHLDVSVSMMDDLAVVRISHGASSLSEEKEKEKVAVDAKTLEMRTKAWVKRILVEEGICPFTKSVTMSGQGLGDLGVPVGSIAYHSSTASVSQIARLMADTMEAIHAMLEAGPEGTKGVSSILLAAPGFDKDFGLWSGPVFTLIEASVVAAKAEAQIGVVCFHPLYQTPDGTSWPGFGHMHSVPRLKQWLLDEESDCPLSESEIAAGGAWQRRTPHATVNVLRADQLEAAEGRRTTENLYPTNIRKLVGEEGVGLETLQRDLDNERMLTLE